MKTFLRRKGIACQLLAAIFIVGINLQSPPSASANARGDDYPYTAIDAVDPWRLYTRQCTSFVAFRLSTVNGFTLPPAYGDANVWGHRAKQEGYQVNMTPTVDAVAWWETPMHVAWVSAVNGDTVEIEEYNYGVRYTYGRRVIPKNAVSGYIHFKDLGAGTTNSQPALAPSGTYTFTSQLAIKSQASLSSPTLDYYYAGESVRYDKVLEADGQQWISYISYSGARRYIAIQPTITQSINNSLPASGSYTIQSYSSVRNNPSLSSPEITFYGAGSVVRYDKVITAEGRTWISYISYSGARRYIAIS
ncbi:SH3 domain-containing protein [Streptococcus suis]|uniref:SH3 domain-containing protein n=1 Tax=Streptococcus suis TaxID=1307 RepID=UPI001ABE5FAF|nr:SH3 domain-containing protein [Streptococcus suis]MBO3837547.1 SH3 domain-containing protein [Streptococcus suis]MDG4479538.1 SH3 domain-containing protein [Streptococcus suis]MDG4485834.1 SH3 domain-containing protein [Streptococcus suis]